MVEHVVHVCTDPEPETLRELEGLQHGEIAAEVMRSTEGVPPSVSKRSVLDKAEEAARSRRTKTSVGLAVALCNPAQAQQRWEAGYTIPRSQLSFRMSVRLQYWCPTW